MSDPVIDKHVAAFLAIKIDDSFFVEGAKPAELEFLRKPVIKAGANIEIAQVHSDSIYGTAGVRVWRRAGEYDEL